MHNNCDKAASVYYNNTREHPAGVQLQIYGWSPTKRVGPVLVPGNVNLKSVLEKKVTTLLYSRLMVHELQS